MRSGGALVALTRATNIVAGWSRYSSHNVQPGEIEIGWTFLGRAYWGGTFNHDMKSMMLTHAFRFVDRVVFRIGETNVRSRRAIEKLGATLSSEPPTAIDPTTKQNVVYSLARRSFNA